MNLVDSSGWLEYFVDGKNAEVFAPAIESVDELLVSTVNLYEVFKKILRERDEHSALKAVAVMQQGIVKDVDVRVSLLGARLSYEKKIPMADSLILATAQLNEAILWTQDSEFSGIDNVRYFEKHV